MGMSMISAVEVRGSDGLWRRQTGDVVTKVFPEDRPDEPFCYGRSYRTYAFLADVRNSYDCPVIAAHRGCPADESEEIHSLHDWDEHALDGTWVTLAELQGFDYEQTFHDRDPSPWYPDPLSVREHLGEAFFTHVGDLAALGAAPEDVRVVLWFIP